MVTSHALQPTRFARTAEAEPQRGEDLLRQVVEASSDAVYVRDLDGRHILCNQRGAEVLGVTPEEVSGAYVWEIFPADVACRLSEADRWVISSGEAEKLDLRLPISPDRSVWLQATVLPREDADGAAGGVIMIAQDVTRFRLEEEALELRERQLADAQRIARLGTWEWDLALDRVTWSGALFQICGVDGRSEVLGFEESLACVHPADRDRTRDIMEHASRTGIPVEFEHRVIRDDGTEAVVLSRGTVTRDEEGRPVRMFGTSQDITVHRDAEKSLRAAMAEAERASEAKSDFLSRMSHELRTPLNAILGFGQIMAADPSLTDRESVEEILGAGQHLLEMINDILDLSRIEAGRVALSIEPVSLATGLRDSCEMLRRAAEKAEVSLPVSFPDEAQVFLLADARRLKQVLLNLISNAIKYNRPGGTVEIGFTTSGDRLRLEVRDTGVGMDSAQLAALFSPFERGKAERSGIEGTGLGLALSKRLVEAMGGLLGVASELGHGSTFWFELPLSAAPGEPPETADDATGPYSSISPRRRKILYVEDNPANLRLVKRIFESRSDCSLVSAVSGAEGLAMAAQERPDLILLDVQLPDLNGDEVLWRLQQDPELRRIPVVAVSGDATLRQSRRLLDLGARRYLTKPLDIPELLQLADEILHEEDPISTNHQPNAP